MENTEISERNDESRSCSIQRVAVPGALHDSCKFMETGKEVPVKKDFNQIFFISGVDQNACTVDGNHVLELNDLVFIPENKSFAARNIRNCSGYCIYFKTEFILPLLYGNNMAEEFPFIGQDAIHVMNIRHRDGQVIREAFLDIINEYKGFNSEKEFIIRDLIHILLLRIRKIYRPHVKNTDEGIRRNTKLSNRFKQLVDKNFLQIREISAYADMLNITPQYLSEVVKSASGKSPRKLINEKLSLEAKVLLGSTDKSLSEIAYLLRFNDQAHFSHFIMNHTGYSPTQIRKNFNSYKRSQNLYNFSL